MSENSEKGSTSVGRWAPFGEMELFDPFFRAARMRGLPGDIRGTGAALGFTPAVDVSENDDEYLISAEVPGASKDDVTVELHEDVLTIRGEKKSERNEQRDHARYTERGFGSFSRAFSLPANADGEKLAASFKDGVLTLCVPKREEAKPRVINIQAS